MLLVGPFKRLSLNTSGENLQKANVSRLNHSIYPLPNTNGGTQQASFHSLSEVQSRLD